ncbi:hypothetical protein [Crossiella cryophila]|uniref:Secreted protein n=1 Tax=Crossiella cryophila TaxID=43355 RepID=A0A7W7CES6_9PSEU|nr:hypothetical protein [Crossiella cryophila]MBB4679843.1 hypothetical protein [Crossiella cryophila]
MSLRHKAIRGGSAVAVAAIGLGVLAATPAAAGASAASCSDPAGKVQACVETAGGSVSPSAFQQGPLPGDCRIRVVLRAPDGRVASTPRQACFVGLTRGPALVAGPGKWVVVAEVTSGGRTFAAASAELVLT